MWVLGTEVWMLTLDEVAERFDGALQSGGGYRAPCPSHDDRNPSLSIDEADDGSGRILLHCHAGCKVEDIMGEAGLTWLDLQGDGRPAGPAGLDPVPPGSRRGCRIRRPGCATGCTSG
jgi:hypothetical protein